MTQANKTTFASEKAEKEPPLPQLIAEGVKSYNVRRIGFARENAELYFDMLSGVVDAKSVSEGLAIYNRFLADAMSRGMDQARALGEVARESGTKVAERLPAPQIS